MTWVLLALSAYFLLAVVELVDKQILSSPLLGPLTYAFYAGLLPVVVIIFWPLDFSFLPPLYTLFALLGGVTFFVAIFFLYEAIIKGEVSRVISIIGGFSPILIFIFSYFFLGERLRFSSLIALFMLVIGKRFAFFRERRRKIQVRTPFFPFLVFSRPLFRHLIFFDQNRFSQNFFFKRTYLDKGRNCALQPWCFPYAVFAEMHSSGLPRLLVKINVSFSPQ